MTEIDGIRTWSYVHKNKVIHKISEKYVKACRRKVRKTVTDGRTDGWTDGDPDGRTDGHHHTIIRPVWRRAYKNDEWNSLDGPKWRHTLTSVQIQCTVRWNYARWGQIWTYKKKKNDCRGAGSLSTCRRYVLTH